MTVFATLSTITNTAYILFCFALGVWAGVLWINSRGPDGQFMGALWTCTILAVITLVLCVIRIVSGEPVARPGIYVLYELYFVIVYPGTFALMRGRDDRFASGIYAIVTIFSALTAISAGDPSRNLIAMLPLPTMIG